MLANEHSRDPFSTMTEPQESTYIPQTVVRIMSTASFEHADTKISSTALKASIEYIRVFTREAIWRSEENRRITEALENQEEQLTAVNTNINANSSATLVLNVKHLEAIAPNLLLDF